MSDEKAIPQILSKLGVVKNPVLLTSTSASTAMMYFSHDLVQSATLLASLTGATVYISSVVVFFSGFFFYVYAYFRLPASSQELVFLQEARITLDEHKKKPRANSRRRVKTEE